MNRIRTPAPRLGYTLVELLVSMTSATLLLAGLGSSIYLGSRAFRGDTSDSGRRTEAAAVQRNLLADLQLATSFSERTADAATFVVPDRNGDGVPETLRYAWSGAVGSPLTFSMNGSTPVAVAQDVRNLRLDYRSSLIVAPNLPTEQTGPSVLLVIADDEQPTADELALLNLIQSWGFGATTAGAGDTPQELLSAAQAAAVIYLSGTIPAETFSVGLEQLSELSTGIVNEHGELADDSGFAAATASNFTTSVTVAENSHYITSSFATGLVTAVTLPQTFLSLTDTPAPGLNTLCTVEGAAALATIDPGGETHDGRQAAGRRVMLPWGSNGHDPAVLSNDGNMLTCRAIEWASGLGDASRQTLEFGFHTVFGTTKSVYNNHQHAARAQLTQPGKVTSISAYVGGKADRTRFAIYSDNNGEPNALLVQTGVGMTAVDMGWVTLPVPQTNLPAGYYWLALSLESYGQKYAYTSSFPGGQERNKSNANVMTRGFLNIWGAAGGASSSDSLSIYATYILNAN